VVQQFACPAAPCAVTVTLVMPLGTLKVSSYEAGAELEVVLYVHVGGEEVITP
jgi:hypothetical protein